MYYSRYLSKESWLEMDNKGKFTITNEEGKELECEVLFTFDSDEFKKNYIVFTDNTLDENGRPVLFSGTVRDITALENQRLALEKSEELRHESEGRFRSIIE